MLRRPAPIADREFSPVGLCWILLCMPAILLGALVAAAVALLLAPMALWGGAKWRSPVHRSLRSLMDLVSIKSLAAQSADLTPR